MGIEPINQRYTLEKRSLQYLNAGLVLTTQPSKLCVDSGNLAFYNVNLFASATQGACVDRALNESRRYVHWCSLQICKLGRVWHELWETFRAEFGPKFGSY